MRPIHLRWLVISSVFIALAAQAATRPHYGGTLRVETRTAIESLDPVQSINLSEAGAHDSIMPLVFDNLVCIDANGAPQPQLAIRWQSGDNNKRWHFWLRGGVLMHDGGTLTPTIAAQSLTTSSPELRVRPTADGLVIESDNPIPGILAELSLPRNAIVARSADGTTVGSGPFRVIDFQPGRRLLLRANEDYWNGRPYLDIVDIALGQSLRDQAMHLQLGRADVIELSPEQVRRAVQDNRRVATSSPSELIAILIPHGTGAAEDPRIREALSLAIDRNAIQNTILQRQGDAAGAILPQWISGYAFLFPTASDLGRARQLHLEAGSNQPPILLSYDQSDSVIRTIAERVALNARDAGIIIQAAPQSSLTRQSAPQIIRIRLNSCDPVAALATVVEAVDPAELARVLSTMSTEDLYQTERSLLEDFRILPIAHVPRSFMLSQRVRNWNMKREGDLPLDNVWVEVAVQ